MSEGTVAEIGAPYDLMKDSTSMFSQMLSESSQEDEGETGEMNE